MTPHWYTELLLLALVWLPLLLLQQLLEAKLPRLHIPSWMGEPLSEQEAAEQGMEPGELVFSGWRLLLLPLLVLLLIGPHLLCRFYPLLALLWFVYYCLRG